MTRPITRGALSIEAESQVLGTATIKRFTLPGTFAGCRASFRPSGRETAGEKKRRGAWAGPPPVLHQSDALDAGPAECSQQQDEEHRADEADDDRRDV
jgi:hypothetical protein